MSHLPLTLAKAALIVAVVVTPGCTAIRSSVASATVTGGAQYHAGRVRGTVALTLNLRDGKATQ